MGLFLILFGVFCLIVSAGLSGDRDGRKVAVLPALIGIGLMAGGVFSVSSAARYNATELGPLYRSWESHWICRRCGQAFCPRPGDESAERLDPLANYVADSELELLNYASTPKTAMSQDAFDRLIENELHPREWKVVGIRDGKRMSGKITAESAEAARRGASKHFSQVLSVDPV